MVTVVVCDDDAFLRQNVSELCEEAGLTVVAETDLATDALELVKRFNVDVLLLDLALPDGSGERILEALREVESQPVVIVLTAYAENPDRLVRLGAREVIEKPNFARLESVLAHLASTASRPPRSADGVDERRRTTRSVPAAPEIWRSPSGISSSRELVQTLRDSVEGDAILLIVARGLESVERDVGPTLAADCRLRPAALLRDTLRIQDVVHEVPAIGGFAAVLRGGDASGAEAAWNRLVVLVAASRVPGHLCGAHTRIDREGGEAGLARVVDALGSAASDAHFLVGA